MSNPTELPGRAEVLSNDELIEIGQRVRGIEASDVGGYFLPITFGCEVERAVLARRAQPEGEAPQAEPTFFVVQDDEGNPNFVTRTNKEAQEHINDACEIGVDGAGKWKAIPVFTHKAETVAAWDWPRRAAAARGFMESYADTRMEVLLGGYHVQPIIRRLAAAIQEWQLAAAATLSPLCGAQHAESGKESIRQHEAIEAAVDQWYPKRDSPHASVNDKIGATRLAFRKGYRAALAAQQAAAPGKVADAEEAAKLQTLLMTEFSCYRVAGGGLFAWAMNALLDNSPHRAPSVPGTPEAPKDERKGIELWRATLRACGELPEGYEVRIELENGCGMAVWYDAEGERHVIDGEGYLSDDVNDAVDAAIQRAAQLDGGQEGSEVSNG